MLYLFPSLCWSCNLAISLSKHHVFIIFFSVITYCSHLISLKALYGCAIMFDLIVTISSCWQLCWKYRVSFVCISHCFFFLVKEWLLYFFDIWRDNFNHVGALNNLRSRYFLVYTMGIEFILNRPKKFYSHFLLFNLSSIILIIMK